ncbi:hypothetical protein CkaCkLH20_08644 [Colletotrichum karsti]|uniref:Cyclase n=1 Tax=Colletotrichum karsti TaxID=1095194 RepID=A0A9P6I8C9_9PEZI|nr:uncharacterized protein CkaCkLH20_08644 [Colletotrichum karsti]KAF9873910.1 hypothetical protein CkaCkLH20_08644 [Colletotrichum karsti]
MVLNLPDYDDLPPVEGMPKGCAWGLFDKDGKKDTYGTLNLLTPDVVKAAGAEVQDGVSVSLNWSLNGLSKLQVPGRKKLVHKVHTLQSAKLSEAVGWDDELEFNTQNSSQWDSLVHWHHQPSGLAYNGFNPTPEDMTAASTAENKMPTIDHWHTRGGVVGRGVLIDYKAYADEKGIEYHPFGGNRITVQEIEAVAAHQGVEFKHGDIFLIRFGSTEAIDSTEAQDIGQMMKGGGGLSGVHGSEETAKWFWNKHFSAAVSDTNSFEAFPPVHPDGSPAGYTDLVLHPYFLSLFGMPIGELWDLSRLSEYCKKTGRYSFMLTSAPMNVPCLVGSPPNAIAIF